MREIKVYLRKEKVDEVVRALQAAGVQHMTVTHVQALGSGVDPEQYHISAETGTLYSEQVQLELVCQEADVDVLVPVIEANARTGEPGDGIVFVSPVDRAVKIRSGVEGREAIG